jgi:hypothetical protein
MSEDSTTPHESDSHASDSPEKIKKAEKHEPIPVAVEVSGTQQTFEKVLKLAKTSWAKAQPVLKEKSVQALLGANRFTNHFLDNIWPKISAQAISLIPDSTKTKVEEQTVKVQPTLNKLKPLWDKVAVPFWQKVVVPTWMKGLAFLRQQLPENLQVLTNRFLTVAILSTTVLVYWFFSSLTSGQPAAAKQPPVPTKPVLTRPAPKPIAQRPSIQPSRAPSAAVKPTPKPVAPVMQPTVVTIPKPIAPAVQPTVVATPKALLNTAENDLIEIQAQLASAAAGIGEGLIASVQTTPNQPLKVSLGSPWEGLSASQQEAVAQKLWEKSQKLQFRQFELFDSTNTKVARSPLIGSNVILLQHPTTAESP